MSGKQKHSKKPFFACEKFDAGKSRGVLLISFKKRFVYFVFGSGRRNNLLLNIKERNKTSYCFDNKKVNQISSRQTNLRNCSTNFFEEKQHSVCTNFDDYRVTIYECKKTPNCQRKCPTLEKTENQTIVLFLAQNKIQPFLRETSSIKQKKKKFLFCLQFGFPNSVSLLLKPCKKITNCCHNITRNLLYFFVIETPSKPKQTKNNF